MENAKQNSNNEVMTEEEAAALLKVCARTLRKLRKGNQIPHRPVGGQIRYLRSQLLAWLATGTSSQFTGSNRSWQA